LIGGLIEVSVSGGGSFFFNEPTNQEWSEWVTAIAKAANNIEADLSAYAKLFDQTFETAKDLVINNASGKEVIFNKDNKRFMSSRDKKEVIQAGFVLRSRFKAVDTKNS
jgi:hypothetical protein